MDKIEDLNYSVPILSPKELLENTPECIYIVTVKWLHNDETLLTQHDICFKKEVNIDEKYKDDLIILHNI